MFFPPLPPLVPPPPPPPHEHDSSRRVSSASRAAPSSKASPIISRSKGSVQITGVPAPSGRQSSQMCFQNNGNGLTINFDSLSGISQVEEVSRSKGETRPVSLHSTLPCPVAVPPLFKHRKNIIISVAVVSAHLDIVIQLTPSTSHQPSYCSFSLDFLIFVSSLKVLPSG